MAATQQASPPPLSALAEGALGDIEKLIEQHFALFRSEIKEELGKAQGAALSAGTGAGLVALSGILGTLTVVHLLHDTLKLPLWVCYALVAGAAGAVGAERLTAGIRQARDVDLLPRRTAQEIRRELMPSAR